MNDQLELVTIKKLTCNLAARTPKKKRKQNNKPDQKFEKEEGSQVYSLDISDRLKTFSHQKRVLTEKRWKYMKYIHRQCQIDQLDFKYFISIVTQANCRKLQNLGYYDQLLKEIPKYPLNFFHCIDKDVPRTLHETHPLVKDLRNILCCYAIRNPSVLYCQGMNYLVAFLLINDFSQEEAFWFIVQLVEDILMPDYFKDLSTVSITTQIFTDLFQQIFPQLSGEMIELGMDPSMFLVGWYVCLFTKGFINSVSQFLLGYLIIQSRTYPIGFILLKISMSVIACILTSQRPFQFQKDFGSLKFFLQKNVNEISLSGIKQSLSYLEYNIDNYKQLEAIYRRKRQANYIGAIQKQLLDKKLTLPICGPQKPVCLHRIEVEKKIGEIQQVLILKTQKPIKDLIVHDYFPKNVKKGGEITRFQHPSDCLLTHHKHICNYTHDEPIKISPQIGFNCQESAYFPVGQSRNNFQDGEVCSRYSKVEDKYYRFSSFFIVDDNTLSDLENVQKIEGNLHKKSQNLQLETSIEEKLKQNDRWARIVIDQEDSELEQSKLEEQKLQYNNKDQNRQGIFSSSINYVIQKAVAGVKILRPNNKISPY